MALTPTRAAREGSAHAGPEGRSEAEAEPGARKTHMCMYMLKHRYDCSSSPPEKHQAVMALAALVSGANINAAPPIDQVCLPGLPKVEG